MTAIINPFVYGGTTVVKVGILPEAAILVRFEVRDTNVSVGMSRAQLAALAVQIDAALAELNAVEPECDCVYVGPDMTDGRGCELHASRYGGSDPFSTERGVSPERMAA